MKQRREKVRAPSVVACLGCVLWSWGGTAAAWAGSVDFEIVSGQVIPGQSYAAKVEVLGAAITTSTYHMPVTVRMQVGDVVIDPFGKYGKAVDGNVNDGLNPRTVVINAMHDPGDVITVAAQSWSKRFGDGSRNNHWRLYCERDTGDSSPFVKVLRNGDDVPDIPGLRDQASIGEFVAGHIDPDSGKVVLREGQAIYVFELGTSDLHSSAADFQDLVVLVTLGQSVDHVTLSDIGDLLAD